MLYNFEIQNGKGTHSRRVTRKGRKKGKEEIFSQAQKSILEVIDLSQKYPNKSNEYKLSPGAFYNINNSIICEPEGKKFIADNFSKIIQFGFKNREPQDDLVQLIKIVANKLKVDNKLPLHDDMEANYQQILSQHKEVYDQLEKLKKVCGGQRFYKEFYVFIDFIYSSKKEKEEQDREKELQAKKAARELLEEAKETGCKPKQPQQKKKKKKSKSQNKSKVTVSATTNETEAQDNKKEEVILEDEEVRKLRKEFHGLIKLLFPDQKSEEFEEKIKKAIENQQSLATSNNKKIKDLYVIAIDFYLFSVELRFDGEKQFNNEVGSLEDNLKAARLMLDTIIPLIDKKDSDFKLHILERSKKHSNLSKQLEVWKSNDSANNEKSNKKRQNKQNTSSGVKSRTDFTNKPKLNALQNLNGSKKTISIDNTSSSSQQQINTELQNNKCKNEESPMECYGPYQPWEYYGPHREWCALSKVLYDVNIEKIHELPIEIRNCSCS